MTPLLLSIDQGTSSSRAILFTPEGDIHAIAQRPVDLIYPQDGWVEQNPLELVQTTFAVIEDVLSRDPEMTASVVAAGITNQRETTICWDRKTGEPVYNAIVWQDRRTASHCQELREQGLEKAITEKTGLLLDPYFSATKLRWILKNVESAYARAKNGDLLFGTVDSYLIWHLTGGKIHATDSTNASRTMLYNIIGQKWDENLLEIFDIPEKLLPDIFENISDYGHISSIKLANNIPIKGVAGDQQAALIGQACFKAGMMKSTYGTGCFALMNIGEKFVPSRNRLLTTVAYKIGGKVTYAAEGSIFNAGTAIQFLRDNIGLFQKSSESESLALSVPDSGGVYFVPAFTGLGAPYWTPDARGVICGLTRDSTKAHIVRAALEAQAYQTRDLIGAMQDDTGHDIDIVRADGGLVGNSFMCQFLADTLQRPVEIPKVTESTAWGAACLAALGAGVFFSLEDVSANWKSAKIYKPTRPAAEMDGLYAGWKKAVEKTF